MSQAAVTEVARKSWPWLILEGILAIVFGVIALVNPGLTLFSLQLLFAAWLIVDGVFEIANAFSDRSDGRHRWIPIVIGALGIIAGILVFMFPGVTLVTLVVLLGIWAIVRGIMQLVAAFQMRGIQSGMWWVGISGVISIMFGILVVVAPGAGALALLWVIGLFAIAFGVMLIVFGLQVRRYGRPGGPTAGTALAA
jgi:uncharacterized membrane protein HdeD (DUF308 family)